MTTETNDTYLGWELFRDPSYYDMWAVRRVGERDFTKTFHVSSESEARALIVEMLATKDSTGLVTGEPEHRLSGEPQYEASVDHAARSRSSDGFGAIGNTNAAEQRAREAISDVVESAHRDVARTQTDFLGRMAQALWSYEGIFDEYPDGQLPGEIREEAECHALSLAGLALAQLIMLRCPSNPLAAFTAVSEQQGERQKLDAWRVSIAEALKEYNGAWVACTGCQESVDGCVSTRDYPFSDIFRCQPGGGCSECGGIGVIWDNTDWADFAKWSIAEDEREKTDRLALVEAVMKWAAEKASAALHPAWFGSDFNQREAKHAVNRAILSTLPADVMKEIGHG